MAEQYTYLQQLLSTRRQVFIYLVSGIKLVGRIVGYDQQTVTIQNELSLQLVYKQAISTIVVS